MDGEQEREGVRLISNLLQRDCVLDSFISVLDLEGQDIENGDDERLRTHARMEGELMRRIEELTRKIDALPAKERFFGSPLALEMAFEQKCSRALEKSRSNQEALRRTLRIMRSQLASIERFSDRDYSSCRENLGPEIVRDRYIDIHI